MRSLSISITSQISVSTVSPVTVERILARHWTAAFDPSNPAADGNGFVHLDPNHQGLFGEIPITRPGVPAPTTDLSFAFRRATRARANEGLPIEDVGISGASYEMTRDDLLNATSGDAQAWVRGRARVELARVALQQGDRGRAAGEARQAESLCQQGQDPVCLDEAKKLLRTSDGR